MIIMRMVNLFSKKITTDMNKILFIDTLTTGTDPRRCAIYRMAGIFCEESVNALIEKERFDLKVCPNDNARIVDTALWTGGTDRKELLSSPKETNVLEDFLSILDRLVNVRDPQDKIYIAGFTAASSDVPFLRELFVRNGNSHFRDYFYLQAIDLMCLSAFTLMNQRQSMPDFHLNTTARFLGIEPKVTQLYNCLVNAETSIEIYKAVKERMNVGINGYHQKTTSLIRNF